MDTENTQIELFEAYLDGNMSTAQKEDFEARLADEPTLRVALEMHRAILQGLQRNAEKRLLKARIEVIGKRALQGKEWRRGWKILGIALLSQLLVVAVWYLGQRRVSGDNSDKKPLLKDSLIQLTNPYIVPPVAQNQSDPAQKKEAPYPSKNPRALLALAAQQSGLYRANDFFNDGSKGSSDPPSAPASLTLAREAFDRSDWTTVISQYKQVLDIHDRPDDLARRGYAHLQIGQVENSIKDFQKLTEVYEWSDQAQWYLLLAYLVAGEKRRPSFEAALQVALQDDNLNATVRYRILELEKQYKYTVGR